MLVFIYNFSAIFDLVFYALFSRLGPCFSLIRARYSLVKCIIIL